MTPEQQKALDKAQDIMWTAMDEPSKARRIQLSEQALAISPECADAYVFLAYDQKNTSADKITMFEEGIRAGHRALGPNYFKEDVGSFWDILETRPYMRARFGLAMELKFIGRQEEAITHFKELLRLCSRDAQGVRYQLITLYIALDRLKEASALIKKYPDDVGPEITYSRALLQFKTAGDSEKAREALGEAVRWNPHVIPFLLSPKFDRKWKSGDYYVTVGGKDEAHEYAMDNREAWHKTPGACDWIIETMLASYIAHKRLHIIPPGVEPLKR